MRNLILSHTIIILYLPGIAILMHTHTPLPADPTVVQNMPLPLHSALFARTNRLRAARWRPDHGRAHSSVCPRSIHAVHRHSNAPMSQRLPATIYYQSHASSTRHSPGHPFSAYQKMAWS